MSPDKDEALRARYPLVFRNPLMNGEGITCLDGWGKLLDALCAKLEALISAEPESNQGSYYAQQIKQKYGLLRFYMSRVTEEMSAAIAEAEARSAKVCDVCGEPGEMCGGEPQKGWYRTRCKEHDGWRGWM